MLSQSQGGRERVISYGSKSLSTAQQNYTVMERELLALVTFVQEYRHYLLGHLFVVRTDHEALKWLHALKEPRGRKARWLEVLSEFSFSVRHRPGQQHANADALSRSPALDSSVSAPVLQVLDTDGLPALSHEQLVARQSADPDLAIVLSWYDASTGEFSPPSEDQLASSSRSVKRFRVESPRLTLVDGLLYRRDCLDGCVEDVLQLVVPESLRQVALQTTHVLPGGGHFAAEKTLLKCRQRFFWPGMTSMVRDFVAHCLLCAQKGPQQAGMRAPLQPMQAGYPFEMLALDLVGPLPATARGNKYLLVVIDYFTRWVDAYALPDTSAITVSRALVERWICQFGAPDRLHSDQGSQFTSAVFQELCQLLGIRKSQTTPYHPQGDGLVERANRTLIQLLRAHCHDDPAGWDSSISMALLSYRSAVHSSTGFTPSRMLLGRELRLPADLVFGSPEPRSESTSNYIKSLDTTLQSVHRTARVRDNASHCHQKDLYDRRVRGTPYKVGDLVWLLDTVIGAGEHRKFRLPWTGPFKVIRCVDSAVYDIVKLEPHVGRASLVKRVHFNRLKPCRSSGPMLDSTIPPQVSVSELCDESEVYDEWPDGVNSRDSAVTDDSSALPTRVATRSGRLSCLPRRLADFVVNLPRRFQ